MSEFSLAERLRYRFDNLMAKGTIALIGMLGAGAAAVIVLFAGIVWIFGLAPEDAGDPGFAKLMWMALMRTLDAGTMGGDEGSWAYLFTWLGVTFGGIFVMSTFIGVLTTGLEAKLEELRKGRSRVIESGHTLILGWGEQVHAIINELTIAFASEERPCIVVLADKDKVEMEDAIRDHVPDPKNTRIVCRSGRPSDMSDLEIASFNSAKAIIVIAPEEGDPDPAVVKTVLAITNHVRRRPQPYHIVAEISDPKNQDVAKLVGKDEVEIILAADMIARVIAQTCRQSGLSVVYVELLDFDGAEIYFYEHASLVGKTFGEALSMFETSTVLGWAPKDGQPALNPPMDTKLRPGDKLAVIAEDDAAVQVRTGPVPAINTAAIRQGEPAPAHPERILILGWNARAATIIRELDHYVARGSTLTVAASAPEIEDELAARCPDLERLAVSVIQGDTASRAVIDSLGVTQFDHVILLSYSGELEPEAADARTLFTLLHLRDISEKSGKRFSIVSEMLDVRNRELADVTRADDFIVSDKLVSLMMSQVSQNKHLNALFADIFDPEGSEIYLRPAADYVQLGTPINFYTVAESARLRGHAAIGYRIAANASDSTRAYGVTVNPVKSEPVTFSAADKIIVVAED